MSMNSKQYVTETWLTILHIDIVIPTMHMGSVTGKAKKKH